jgi:hypothetical protein
MSKLLISYINSWAAGTVTASTEHPSFPATNSQHRWYKKPWRSRYGTDSGWGLFRIVAGTSKLYFDEGGAELTATITAGDYNADTLCAEIKTQMEAAGALTFTVTYDDATNFFTIAGSGNFSLHLSSTTNAIWASIGWTSGVDTASAATHTAEEIRIHTSELLYCDAGATADLRFIAIKGHNLQSTATVTVRYYSDAFVTLVDSEALTWHAGQIAARTAQSYRYFSVEASDPDNPDGFIEIGLVWAGSASVLHYGFAMERSMIPEDPSIVSSSDDGQESTIQMTKYKGWTYTFEAVEPNTDKPLLLAIFEEIGKTRPCFISEAPPASGDIGATAEYVTLPEWEWSHIAGLYWALTLGVRTQR